MILTALLMACGVFAQAPPAGERATAAALTELARGARAKGDITEAVRLVGEAIEREPASREAAALKIDLTASTGAVADALAAYDRYVGAAGRGDRALLAPIARAELWKLGENDLADVRAAALASLALAGDRAARKELERAAAAGTDATVSADAALALVGQERAAGRIAERIRQGNLGSRLSALGALKEMESAPASVERAVTAALDDKQTAVRAAAAQAAGHLKVRGALPALRRIIGEPLPYLVKLSAAVALHRMGDPAGDVVLQQALASELAEARTFAASAYTVAEAKAWRPAIEPLLTSASGLDALNVAELLVSLGSAPAQQILEKLTADPNPSIRARAARVAARQRTLEPALIRRLLGDSAPLVRLYTAQGMTRSGMPDKLTR